MKKYHGVREDDTPWQKVKSWFGYTLHLVVDTEYELPVAYEVTRATYSWRREYNKRTAIERVNSRLDVSFGFERHFIRGLDKMKLRCSLALLVMLAMALGRARENQHEYIRSLVRAA